MDAMYRSIFSLFLLITTCSLFTAGDLIMYTNDQSMDDVPTTVSFPIANCLDSKFSYDVDAFPAIALPVTFTKDASCTPILRYPLQTQNGTDMDSSRWLKNTRMVFVMDWKRDARVCGCTSQQMLVDRMEVTLVSSFKKQGFDVRRWIPIFAGRLSNFADVVGPYIAKLGTFDCVGTTMAAADAVSEQAATRGYVQVTVAREIGPWNAVFASKPYVIMHWSVFALNMVMLLVAGFRLRMQLKIQKDMAPAPSWGTATKELFTSRDPQIVLHFTAVVYFIISLTGIQERLNKPLVQAIAMLKWFLFIAAMTAIKTTWCRVAHSVTKRKRYHVLRVFSVVVIVIAGIVALLSILTMVVPQMARLLDVLYVTLLVGVPGLLMIRAALFVSFSLSFLSQITRERVAYLPMRRLQVLTANGVISSFAYFLILVSGCLFVLPVVDSPTGYLIANACVCIAGIMAQLGVFILPTANEIIFNNTEDTDEGEGDTDGGAPGPITSYNDTQHQAEWKSWNRASQDSHTTHVTVY